MIPSRGFRREFSWETVWIPWLKAPHQPLCKNLSSGVFFYQFEALKKKKKILVRKTELQFLWEAVFFSQERSFWEWVIPGTNGLYQQAEVDGGKLSLPSSTGMNSKLTWRAWDPELEYMHWRGWLFSPKPKTQTSASSDSALALPVIGWWSFPAQTCFQTTCGLASVVRSQRWGTPTCFP